MNKFYKKLGLKPLNKLLKIKLNKSLRKHFKISSIKYYNIIFDLFLFNSINKILNNKNQIVKIINKIKYIYKSYPHTRFVYRNTTRRSSGVGLTWQSM